MSKVVTPYNTVDSKKKQVSGMFNNIAENYDKLNLILSMGIDKFWRKKAISMLQINKGDHILDIATGTADLAIAMAKKGAVVTGVDISEGMLVVGRGKVSLKGLSSQIVLNIGDAEELKFNDNHFDGATVAFGVRNFENPVKGLAEICRVLKTGSKLVVLEFSKPSAFPVKQLFGIYSKIFIPFVGKIISGDTHAYKYLPESVQAFPEREEFLDILQGSGFKEVYMNRLTFGIVTLYTGIK